MKIRTRKIIITITFILFALLLGDAPRILLNHNLEIALQIDWLPILHVVLIVYSTICFFVPWLLKRQLVKLGKSKHVRFLLGVDTLVCWLSFVAAPAVIGLALFLFGSSETELHCFVIPAAVDTAAWGIYNNCCIDRFISDLYIIRILYSSCYRPRPHAPPFPMRTQRELLPTNTGWQT